MCVCPLNDRHFLNKNPDLRDLFYLVTRVGFRERASVLQLLSSIAVSFVLA